MPNDYDLVRKKRVSENPLKRSPILKPSDKNTLTPDYLLQHENRFDPNVYTPEQLMQKNPNIGGQEPVQKT